MQSAPARVGHRTCDAPENDVTTCPTCGAQRLGDASVERGTDPSVSADDVAGILAEPSPEPLAYLVEGSFSGGSGRLRCAMLHPPLRADLYSVTPLYALRPPSTAAKP